MSMINTFFKMPEAELDDITGEDVTAICQGTEVIGTEHWRHYFPVKLFFVFE